MSTEQLDLTFAKPRKAKPALAELVAFLRGKSWQTAEEISEANTWNDRDVRRLASASDEVISYPGSPGYKLLCECTCEEYEHYRNARKSQARDMIAKVIRTDRVFYRRTGATI